MYERASPKPIVSKAGKRQARICKGVFPGESEPWKILDIEHFMIQFQHAVMERSIAAYLKACDWNRTRGDSLRVLLPFFTRGRPFRENPFFSRVSRYMYLGLWNSAWKRYKSARPKDRSKEDGSCNLVLASRRIKARTKPTVWQFTNCSVLVLGLFFFLFFFLVRSHFMIRVHGEPWICIPSCSINRVSRGSFPTTARSVTQGPLYKCHVRASPMLLYNILLPDPRHGVW